MTLPNGSPLSSQPHEHDVDEEDERKLAALPDALEEAYRSSPVVHLHLSSNRTFVGAAHTFSVHAAGVCVCACTGQGTSDGKIEIYETERIHCVKEGEIECELEIVFFFFLFSTLSPTTYLTSS